MTQQEFNALPGRLTRKLFLQVTGISEDDLDQMRQSKELDLFYPHPNGSRRGQKKFKKGYAKYSKADAARIAGYKL